MQKFERFKIDIYDHWFYNVPNNTFEMAESSCIVGLTIILNLLQRKNFTSLYINSFLLVSEKGLSPESCLAI